MKRDFDWERWFTLLILSIGFIVFFSGRYWVVALPTLAMIGLHELGHLAAAKYYGLETGGFYFIPGLGGVALIKEWPAERWRDFVIAYAGPLAGLTQVIFLLFINLFFQSNYLSYLANLWALINLFNLASALPLDGGKICWSIFGSKIENYFESIPYLVLTVFALGFVLAKAGPMWFLMIAFFGWQERNLFLHQEESVFKIDMADNELLISSLLYIGLALVFILIIAA